MADRCAFRHLRVSTPGLVGYNGHLSPCLRDLKRYSRFQNNMAAPSLQQPLLSTSPAKGRPDRSSRIAIALLAAVIIAVPLKLFFVPGVFLTWYFYKFQY
jgi:hypothetical protein